MSRLLALSSGDGVKFWQADRQKKTESQQRQRGCDSRNVGTDNVSAEVPSARRMKSPPSLPKVAIKPPGGQVSASKRHSRPSNLAARTLFHFVLPFERVRPAVEVATFFRAVLSKTKLGETDSANGLYFESECLMNRFIAASVGSLT